MCTRFHPGKKQKKHEHFQCQRQTTNSNIQVGELTLISFSAAICSAEGFPLGSAGGSVFTISNSARLFWVNCNVFSFDTRRVPMHSQVNIVDGCMLTRREKRGLTYIKGCFDEWIQAREIKNNVRPHVK